MLIRFVWNRIFRLSLMDGGISDSVPISKSILDGNRKNVVVLTKEEGFRRKAGSAANLALIKMRYLKYPKVYELMKNRHSAYNQMLDYLEEQVKAGRAFVIRPGEKSDVGRIEKDEEKLSRLYEQGYREAKEQYEQLKSYLDN